MRLKSPTPLILCIAVLALCGLTVAAGAAETLPSADKVCLQRHVTLDRLKLIKEPQLNYPSREQNQLGEGWARFVLTATETGSVKDIWLRDALGSPVYAELGAKALAQVVYEPPTIRGALVQTGVNFEIVFQIEGENRAGTHAWFTSLYDRARDLRRAGDFEGALIVLKRARERPANLYESSTLSYALAVTYMGLKDWCRALREIELATISNGQFADSGVRAAALALDIQLLTHAHDFYPAICKFETLMDQYPAFRSTPLEQAVAKAREELASTAPVETAAEIIESGRPDIATKWSHELLRHSFSVEKVEGTVGSFRLSCTGFVISGEVQAGRLIDLPPEPRKCELFVFGDPGARFVLNER